MKLIKRSAFILPIVLLAGCSGTWNYVDQPQLSLVGTQKPLHEAVGELFTASHPSTVQDNAL
jgi:hypothetical protein